MLTQTLLVLVHHPSSKLKALATKVVLTEGAMLPGMPGAHTPPKSIIVQPPPLNIGQEALCAHTLSLFHPSAVLTCMPGTRMLPLGILKVRVSLNT